MLLLPPALPIRSLWGRTNLLPAVPFRADD